MSVQSHNETGAVGCKSPARFGAIVMAACLISKGDIGRELRGMGGMLPAGRLPPSSSSSSSSYRGTRVQNDQL